MQTDVNTVNTERQKECIQLKAKTEQFVKTHNKMKNVLQDFEEEKKARENEVKPDISAIESSQKFISEEFEKLKKNVTEGSGDLQSQIREMAQVVEYNVKSNNRQRQYTHEECLVVVGVSENEQTSDVNDQNSASNHCQESKKAIVDLCKELNLIIDPNNISIAHWLKKGKFSKGLRPIIVKFNSKELCREVYEMRNVCKEIDQWAFDRNAKRIYINESLTPQKRKLLEDFLRTFLP